MENTCRREFEEETGYQAKLCKMLDARIGEQLNQKRVIIPFHVTIEDGELTKAKEHSEIGFCKTQAGKMVTD